IMPVCNGMTMPEIKKKKRN
ncbi:hypothetical protein PAT3040_06366, partial [Paenibacillus agaridevorans]